MSSSLNRIALAGTLGLALAAPAAVAQTSAGTGLRMPYERDFWGHVGVSIGRAKLKTDCPAGAFECDLDDQVFRAFAGGRFNNAIGGEVGYLRFGDFQFAGGEVQTQALDFTLLAGFPFAKNAAVFGKVGVVYARTEVSTLAPGVATGDENGWGPRFGFGVQLGINENWALRADLDRYRIKLPGGRDSFDTYSIGALYTFR